MFFGVLLTVSIGNDDLSFIEEFVYILEVYWPLVLSFIGIYLVSTPRKKR